MGDMGLQRRTKSIGKSNGYMGIGERRGRSKKELGSAQVGGMEAGKHIPTERVPWEGWWGEGPKGGVRDQKTRK